MGWLGRSPRFLLTAAALILLATACSDDGGSPSGDEDATSTTDPPALDEEVVAHVQALIDESDEITARLAADPSMAEDPDNADLQRKTEIFTPDADTPELLVESLQGLAEDGIVHEAIPGETYRQTNIFAPEALDADTLAFEYCLTLAVRVVEEDGSNEDSTETSFGRGEVRRVDGAWRIHEQLYTEGSAREGVELEELPDEGCDEGYVEQERQRLGMNDQEESAS